jgi:cysteinyl-tRNA synthetase
MAVALALLDDLNTPSAISELSAPLKSANDLLTTKAGRKAPNRINQLAAIERQLGQVLCLLGLVPAATAGAAVATQADSHVPTSHLPLEIINQVLTELRRLALVRANLCEDDVAARIAIRGEARQAKDFQAADRVRVELAGKGVMIMDTAEGTTWRPGLPVVTENVTV